MTERRSKANADVIYEDEAPPVYRRRSNIPGGAPFDRLSTGIGTPSCSPAANFFTRLSTSFGVGGEHEMFRDFQFALRAQGLSENRPTGTDKQT